MNPMNKPSIPFFGVAREFAEHRDAMMRVVEDVLATGRVLQGPSVSAFETQVATLVGRKHGVAVGSATDALFFALRAANVGPGDEVLVTDFSFVASAQCITRLGARPIFCDIDEHYNLDLERAEARIGPRTKALVFVHLYGQMSNPADIEGFAKAHDLTLIEDAAQALGARWKDRAAGSLGEYSCISFDPTKVIGAPGSGGIVLVDSDQEADQLRRMRYHGKDSRGRFVEQGFNSQMPSVTAALLEYKLGMNDVWAEKRAAIAGTYNEGIGALNAEFTLPVPREQARHIYHKYVLRHPERDALRAHLTSDGIASAIHYAVPLHQHPCFQDQDSVSNQRAETFARTVLSLPIHPFLSAEEANRVVESIGRFAARS